MKEPTERKEMYIPIPESIMLEAIDKNQLNSMPEEMTGMFWEEDYDIQAIVYEDEDAHVPYM